MEDLEGKREEFRKFTVELSEKSVRKIEEWSFKEKLKNGRSPSLDQAIARAIDLLVPERKKYLRKIKYSLAEVTGQRVVGYILQTARLSIDDGLLSRQLLFEFLNKKTSKNYNIGSVNTAERAGLIDNSAGSIRRFNAEIVSDLIPVLEIPLSIQEIEKIGRGEYFDASKTTLSLEESIKRKESELGGIRHKAFRDRCSELGLTSEHIELAKQGVVRKGFLGALSTLLGMPHEQILLMSIAQLHKKFVKEAEDTLRKLDQLRSE
jgi:hypothetical protein